MKKTFFLLLSGLICIQLFATTYGSNSLGQKLSDNTDGYEYILVEESNTSVLYKDNDIIWQKTRITDGDSIELKIVRYDIPEEQLLLYKDGVLISFKDGLSVTTYIYKENQLEYTFKSENGEIIQAEYYMRDPISGSLIGIRKYDGITLFSSDSMITGDKTFTSVKPSLITDKPFRLVEDGNIEIYAEDLTQVYSTDGLLKKSVSPEMTLEYEYNSYGSLVKKTEILSDGSKTVFNYIQNDVSSVEKYENNIISYITEFNINGFYCVKRIYSEGTHIANVWYKNDSVSASEIEYLGGNK